MEAAAIVHDSVALPEPVTLVGEMVHDVLLVVRLTTPVKPLTAVIVIVDVPAVPAFTVTIVGVAVMVKFTMLYVTVTECDSEPLVPVTPTCTVEPVVNVQDSVALPEPVTLVGDTVHDAVVLVTRLTTPAKPLRAVIVIVDVPAEPALTVTLVGLAAIVKS